MMKSYVIVNEFGNAMQYLRNPWQDKGFRGKVLCHGKATKFMTHALAKAALAATLKYAKTWGDLQLVKAWHINEWKIKLLKS